MAEHPNVAIVRNAYESFSQGDLDGALADLADDCVFQFGGDGPNSGDHKGREAIAREAVPCDVTAVSRLPCRRARRAPDKKESS